MMAATTATAPCVLPALPVEMAAEFLKQQLQADDLHELGGVGHVPAQPHGMRLQSDATFTTATSSSSVPSASASGAFSSPEAQVRAWPGAGAGAGSDSDDFMLDDVQPDFGQLEDLLKFMPDGVKLVTEPGATPKIECAPTTAASGTPTAAAVQAKTLRIHSSTLVGTASSASTTSSNAPVLPVLLPMAPTSAPTASAASGAVTITDALSAGFAAPTSNTATTAAAPTATAATVAASVAPPPPPRPRTSAPKPRRSTTRRARTKRAMPDLDVPEEPIKIDESLLAGLDPKKRKKQLRLLRNRASASRSRLRKKAQSEFLARELDELRVLTDDQVKDITALTQRNDELETEVADLRTQLGLPPRRRDPVHIITAAAMSARSRDGSSTIHSSDDDSTSNSGSGSGSAAPLKRQRRTPPKHRGGGGVGGRNAAAGGAVLLAVVFAFALGAFNIADLITHDGPGLMGGASPLRTTSNGRVLLQHDHEATLAMGAATATADGGTVDPSAPALLSPSAAAAAAVNALALPHLAKVVLVNAVILLVIVSMSMFALGRWSTATAVAAQAPASSPKRRRARVTAGSGTSSSSSSDSDDGSSVDSCSAPESRRKQGGVGVGAGVGAGAGAGSGVAVAEQLGIAPRLSRYAQSVLAAALVSTATGNYASFARSLSAAPASAVQTALQQRYEGAVAAGVPPATSVASDDGTRGPGRGRASTDPMPTM